MAWDVLRCQVMGKIAWLVVIFGLPAACIGQVGSDTYYDNIPAGDIVSEAPQAPPPLQDSKQTPCPGEDLLWTPGYWNYAASGFTWTPGEWVKPPQPDVLWTPPFWFFYKGHYLLRRGYWGSTVGFYGGISYGSGYSGWGFDGGYWENHHFRYNRAVMNVDPNVVHNTYSLRAVNWTPQSRVAFNGGSGGTSAQPPGAEVAGDSGLAGSGYQYPLIPPELPSVDYGPRQPGPVLIEPPRVLRTPNPNGFPPFGGIRPGILLGPRPVGPGVRR
jgi:hypothetical protein